MDFIFLKSGLVELEAEWDSKTLIKDSPNDTILTLKDSNTIPIGFSVDIINETGYKLELVSKSCNIVNISNSNKHRKVLEKRVASLVKPKEDKLYWIGGE